MSFSYKPWLLILGNYFIPFSLAIETSVDVIVPSLGTLNVNQFSFSFKLLFWLLFYIVARIVSFPGTIPNYSEVFLLIFLQHRFFEMTF